MIAIFISASLGTKNNHKMSSIILQRKKVRLTELVYSLSVVILAGKQLDLNLNLSQPGSKAYIFSTLYFTPL